MLIEKNKKTKKQHFLKFINVLPVALIRNLLQWMYYTWKKTKQNKKGEKNKTIFHQEYKR